MFAVRDSRSGKFLRTFSGSYNDARWKTRYKLRNQLGREPTEEETHAALFCLDTPDGAKVYKNQTAVSGSFYSFRYRREEGKDNLPQHRRYIRLSLAEALPWLEIVEVKITYRCK